MTHLGDPDCRISVQGKQVMLDGEHLADARDETAAQVIGLMLLGALNFESLTAEQCVMLQEFFA